jgi:HAD superfamily hydrolase (TIGR01549 family)
VRVTLRHFTRERSRTTSVGGSRKLIKLAFASLPGAIGALAERELRLGICTNKQEGIAPAILEKVKLLPMFGSIIGGDSGFGLKPSPAPLYAALQRLKATSPRTVFVGDSAIDDETAFVAEVPFARSVSDVRLLPGPR